MGEWIECTLGDIVTFQRGHDLPKTKMTGEGYPVAGSNGVIGYHSEFTTKAPAITIGRSGNVGNPYIYYENIWAHNTTLYIKEYKNVIPEFVYYFLKTLDLGSFAGGSAVPTLNRNHIHTLPIRIPKSKEDQEAIADILRTLDKKIEANDKINRNLLEQAIAVFTEKIWSQEKNGTIGDYCVMKSGFAFKSSWWTGEGVKVIKIGDINQDNLNLNTCSCVEEDKIEKAKEFKVRTGDLVLAMTGATIGKFAMIPERDETILVNQRVGKFFLGDEPLKRIPFIYCTLKMDEVYSEVIGRGQGSAQPNISANDVMTIPCVIPSQKEIDDFNTFAEPIYTNIVKNQNENEKLANLRDSLLPKLMSGELDVSDLEI